MLDLTKLAKYLDSFDPTDPSYDYACYLKTKIATDLQDPNTINNGDEAELDDNDVTMATPEQQTNENAEGELMHGAFQELEALNKYEEQKDKVIPPTDGQGQITLHSGSPEMFGNNYSNQKQASAYIKDICHKDLPKDTQKDIERFVHNSKPNTEYIHYGLVVKELLPKVDDANFAAAEKHVKGADIDKDELYKKVASKYVLILNDKIIDGHHHLAKCKAAGITNSLNVLDLTPARFQK